MKNAVRRLRAWRPLNALATHSVRLAARGKAPSWAVTHLPRTGRVKLRLPNGKTALFWSNADDWITSRLWWLGVQGFEPESAEPFMRFAESAAVILDVGAYTGYYSVVAAVTNPNARVFAFEPHPEIAARCGRNLSLNGLTSVTLVPNAVADHRGPVSFHEGGASLPSSSSIAEDWSGLYRTRIVGGIDLDSFVEDWSLETVDLIKIDVETAEPLVFAGMTRVLRDHRPVVFVELLPGTDTKRIEEALSGLDYVYFHLTFDGPVAEDRPDPGQEYVDHLTTPVNHLLCPREKVPSWLVTRR